MGLIGKAGSTEEKAITLKSQVDSHLAKEIKTNSKRLFSYIKQIVKGSKAMYLKEQGKPV